LPGGDESAEEPAELKAFDSVGRNYGRKGQIIAALAQVPGQAGSDALIKVFKSVESTRGLEPLALKAARALAERGDPRAQEALEALRHGTTRFEAEEALDVLREKAGPAVASEGAKQPPHADSVPGEDAR